MSTNERHFSIVWLLVTTLIATLATGVSVGGQGDREWMAPPAAERRTNPLTQRPEAVAGGEKLFRQRCATCHGADGRGSRRAPSLAAPDVLAQSDGTLFWKISSGNTRRGMPSFSFLPEVQRWQLVSTLRSLEPRR